MEGWIRVLQPPNNGKTNMKCQFEKLMESIVSQALYKLWGYKR